MADLLINNLEDTFETETHADISECGKSLRDRVNEFNDLSIFHLNIRSVSKHFDEFLTIFQMLDFNFDLIIFSESWLDNTATNLFHIPGYQTHIIAPKSNKCDGIIFYIKPSLIYHVHDIKISEACCSKIHVCKNNKNYYIWGIYRSPSTNKIEFINQLVSEISQPQVPCTKLVVGDININILQNNTTATTYLNEMLLNGFQSLINLPTRETEFSATCPDHIFCKTDVVNSKYAGILKLHVTDHYGTFVIIKNDNHSLITANRMAPQILAKTMVDEKALLQLLKSENWDDVFNENDPNISYDNFITALQNYKSLATKEKIMKINSSKHKIKPWITDGVIRSIRIRDKLASRIKNEPENIELRRTYIHYRNKITCLIKRLKNDYYKMKIESASGNIRKIWQVINSSTGDKTIPINHSYTLDVVNDNAANRINSIENPREVAGAFNKYFSEIGANLASQITKNNKTYFIEPSPTSLFLNPITETEVLGHINELKNNSANGPDNIGANLIKIVVTEILKPLTHIFNLCLQQGIFPDKLKISHITPIYKSGSRTDCANYRPISLTDHFAKLLEKCLKTRMLNFLLKNSLLANCQFGFIPGKNTELAINNLLTHYFANYEKKEKSLGIFLDLKKAFDTVSHRLILNKIESYGIRGIAFKLIKSFLSRRIQCTKIHNSISDNQYISFGVPQGTVLGPLLFVLYINDLFKLKIHGKFTAYADDTAIIISGKTWNEVTTFANSDLKKIKSWMDANLLSLNLEKTIVLPFNITETDRHEIPGIHVNNNILPCRLEIKYLGVVVDSMVTWKPHIQNLCKRLRHMYYKFRQIRSFLAPKLLKMVYYALVQSILEYGILCWGSAYKTVIKPLRTAQNIIIKIISKKPMFYRTHALYSEYEALPIIKLYAKKIILFVHQNPNKFEVIPSRIPTRAVTNEHIAVPLMRTKKAQHQIKFFGPKLYNILPLDLRRIRSFAVFKRKVSAWLIQNNECYDILP